MADEFDEELSFNDSLRARVKELRELHRYSQADMAGLLGIPLERYKKYESRSPMPAYLLPRFAAIVGVDVRFMLTGKQPRGERASR